MACRRAASEATRAAPRFAHLLPQALTDTSSLASSGLMRLHTVAHHATPGAGAGAGGHVAQSATGVPVRNLPSGGWGNLRSNMGTWEVPVSTAEATPAQAASAQASSAQAASAQAMAASEAAAEGAAAGRAPGQGPWAQGVQGAQGPAQQAGQQGVGQAAQPSGQPQKYHSMCRARWYASSCEGRTHPFFWRRRPWPSDSLWARGSANDLEWGLLSRPGAVGPTPPGGAPPAGQVSALSQGLRPFSDPLAWAQEVTRELSEAAAGRGRVLGKPWGVQEAAEEFRFKFGLPGVGKEGVRVQIQDSNVLTVEAKQRLEEKGGSWAAQTESWFQRKLRLPEGVKPQEVSAEMKDGVLTVKVPKVQPTLKESLAVDVPIA